MSIKVVLFDLDGTLLPIDQPEFIKRYFKGLIVTAVKFGYDAESVREGLMRGTKYIAANDGCRTGEEAFWAGFCEVLGDVRGDIEPHFEQFYEQEFDKIIALAEPTAKAKEAVEAIKAMGLRAVLATSPFFPAVATHKRARWAGFSPSDFEIITTYENSHFAKPAIPYYEELVKKLGVLPEECLMVGNDAYEDMIAEKLGMKVFLMPRCLINDKNLDTSGYPQGDFDDLIEYVRNF